MADEKHLIVDVDEDMQGLVVIHVPAGGETNSVPATFVVGGGQDYDEVHFRGSLSELAHTFRAYARACDNFDKEIGDNVLVERVFD